MNPSIYNIRGALLLAMWTYSRFVFSWKSETVSLTFPVFLTGSDRIPILGMKSLKLVIQPTGGGEHYLPVAHTCFNLLDLPKYTSLETLQEKLLQAIDHNQGFNLAWKYPEMPRTPCRDQNVLFCRLLSPNSALRIEHWLGKRRRPHYARND